MWRDCVAVRQVRSKQWEPEEEVSYNHLRVTAVIGSFTGWEGVGVMPRDITNPPLPLLLTHTHKYKHTHTFLLKSFPTHPRKPPAERNPSQSPSRLRPLSIAAEINEIFSHQNEEEQWMRSAHQGPA